MLRSPCSVPRHGWRSSGNPASISADSPRALSTALLSPSPCAPALSRRLGTGIDRASSRSRLLRKRTFSLHFAFWSWLRVWRWPVGGCSAFRTRFQPLMRCIGQVRDRLRPSDRSKLNLVGRALHDRRRSGQRSSTELPHNSRKSRRTVSACLSSQFDSERPLAMRENPDRQTCIAAPGTGTAARRCLSIRASTLRSAFSRSTCSSATVMEKSIGLSLNRTP